MTAGEDFLNNFFKDHTGIGPSGYLCTKCRNEVEMIVVKTTIETPRKLFFCPNKYCKRFGVVTVVAIKK